MTACTDDCRKTVYCALCRRRKAPVGRSVGMGAEYSYCMLDECDGYQRDPKPPHLWPSECLACWTRFIDGLKGDCDECKAKAEADE